MIESELQEHVRRTSERASLDRYIPRRFTNASETGEVPVEQYQFRGVFRERAPGLDVNGGERIGHCRGRVSATPPMPNGGEWPTGAEPRESWGATAPHFGTTGSG